MAKERRGAHREEGVDSMGKDPLRRDRRYDDAGNPVERWPRIERVAEKDDGNIGPLPKV